MSITFSKTGQAMPEKTVKLDTSAFDTISGTEVYWLGNSSLLINSRGTIILIDPILDSFDMPLLIDMPIASRDILGSMLCSFRISIMTIWPLILWKISKAKLRAFTRQLMSQTS